MSWNRVTLKKWICQLKQDKKKSKKQSFQRKDSQQLFCAGAFKQKIVNEVLSGKLNKRQALIIYGITWAGRQWQVPIDGADEDGNKAICKFVKLHW